MHLCAFVEKKKKKIGIQCQTAKTIHNHCVSSLSFSCSTQKVNRVKMCKASNARGQNDPQSLCVVFVIFLFYTKVNGMKKCMFSFNRVKLQSFRVITSSLAWLF